MSINNAIAGIAIEDFTFVSLDVGQITQRWRL